MRFDIDAHDWQAIELLGRLVQISGPAPWNRKVRALRQQVSSNPFLREWQAERNAIELKLAELFDAAKAHGKFPVHVQDQSHYELYGFAAGVVRIYERLSDKGKKRLEGMLRDGLQPDNNLLSLQHEIVTAVHLVSRGYDVVMNDLENGSGVDFIAAKDGLEIEVECKMFTGDLGRPIHRNKVLMLHRHLADVVENAFKQATRGLLVRIEIPNRLTCQPPQMDGIKRALATAFVSGGAVVRTAECEVDVFDFDVQQSPFRDKSTNEIDQGAIRAFAHERLGKANRELIVLFSPGRRAVVVQVQSAKEDETLKGAYRQLREAARGQFSKTRPGILAVQFQELTADDLLNIATSDSSLRGRATGLQIMTSDFLTSPSRRHIYAVVYRSQGTLARVQGNQGRSTLRSEGPAYIIPNPDNPSYGDPRCAAFTSR